ncbi:hypothetical protein, partial [uncultured Dubosiella sp.]|uniref:hypothetical protein n=1 Tax=uncultured Dubosiella sp. TaxID=1937011 RepID=UPI00272B5AB3
TPFIKQKDEMLSIRPEPHGSHSYDDLLCFVSCDPGPAHDLTTSPLSTASSLHSNYRSLFDQIRMI